MTYLLLGLQHRNTLLSLSCREIPKWSLRKYVCQIRHNGRLLTKYTQHYYIYITAYGKEKILTTDNLLWEEIAKKDHACSTHQRNLLRTTVQIVVSTLDKKPMQLVRSTSNMVAFIKKLFLFTTTSTQMDIIGFWDFGLREVPGRITMRKLKFSFLRVFHDDTNWNGMVS